MICPKESIENAKLAKKKLDFMLGACQRYGWREFPWLVTEVITRVFVSFGAAYCTYFAVILAGRSNIDALLGAVMIFVLGILLSLLCPLMTDTRYILHHARLLYVIQLMNAIIESLDTLSAIEAESPDLFSSESGVEARITRTDTGDLTIEAEGHRYVFPMGSDYMKVSEDTGIATIDFDAIDRIIGEVKGSPISIKK